MRAAGQADPLLRLLRMDPTDSGLPAGLEEAPLTFGPTFPFDPVTHDFVASPVATAAVKHLSSPSTGQLLARQYSGLQGRRRGWPGRVVYSGPEVAVRCSCETQRRNVRHLVFYIHCAAIIVMESLSTLSVVTSGLWCIMRKVSTPSQQRDLECQRMPGTARGPLLDWQPRS